MLILLGILAVVAAALGLLSMGGDMPPPKGFTNTTYIAALASFVFYNAVLAFASVAFSYLAYHCFGGTL